jgi:GT2 family glycosyltransferase
MTVQYLKATKFSLVALISNEDPSFLHTMFQKLFMQTYPYWELILIVDNTRNERLKTYLSQISDNRVTIVYIYDKATKSSMINQGFSHVTGDYVIFIDMDDDTETTALATISRTLNHYPYDIILNNPIYRYQNKEVRKEHKVPSIEEIFCQREYSDFVIFKKSILDFKFSHDNYKFEALIKSIVKTKKVYYLAQYIYIKENKATPLIVDPIDITEYIDILQEVFEQENLPYIVKYENKVEFELEKKDIELPKVLCISNKEFKLHYPNIEHVVLKDISRINDILEDRDAKYIMMMFDSVPITFGLVENIIKTFEDPMVGIVGCKVINKKNKIRYIGSIRQGSKVVPITDKSYLLNYERINTTREYDSLSKYCIMFAKSTWEKVRFNFNEKDFIFDFCYRVKEQLGLKVIYNPNSEVVLNRR